MVCIKYAVPMMLNSTVASCGCGNAPKAARLTLTRYVSLVTHQLRLLCTSFSDHCPCLQVCSVVDAKGWSMRLATRNGMRFVKGTRRQRPLRPLRPRKQPSDTPCPRTSSRPQRNYKPTPSESEGGTASEPVAASESLSGSAAAFERIPRAEPAEPRGPAAPRAQNRETARFGGPAAASRPPCPINPRAARGAVGMADCDAAHYPERLGTLYVINCPPALATAYKLIRSPSSTARDRLWSVVINYNRS